MDKKKKAKGSSGEQKNRDMFLKKHVGLIHCENRLTLIQRKICNILLFNALEKINDQEVHEISLKQLCSLVGYNSHDSKLIKESIKSLISVVMEWNLLEDNKAINAADCSDEAITWNASALLAGASIKAGVVSYSYSPQIKSVLSSLDIYGRINLFVQSKFNSSYSLVLYENAVRFKNIQQTAWFPIELFRSLMGVAGDKYASFKEFKRNVITTAVKEVNQKSDIFIEPQFKKAGRNITSIQFLIRDNEAYAPSFRKNSLSKIKSTETEQSSLAAVLCSEYQLSEKQAREIISSYEHDYIMEKIQLIKAKKNVGHLGAYLISALKKDFKMSQAVVKKPIKIEESPIRESKQASEIRSLKNKYVSYKLNRYLELIQKQAQHIQDAVKEKFEAFLFPNQEVFRFYKKSQYSSVFVRPLFINFIEEHFSDLLGDVLSFDDYIISDDLVSVL